MDDFFTNRMPLFPFIKKLMTPYKSNEEIASAWQTTAQAKNLKFIPGSRTVIGNYRDHYFKLDIVYRAEQHNYPNTRLACSLNNRMNHQSSSENKNSSDKKIIVTDIVSRLAPYDLSTIELKGSVYFGPNAQICYEQIGIETHSPYLQFLIELLCDIADGYPTIVSWGAEAIPALQEISADKEHKLHQIATQLLYDIGKETTTRLSDKASQLLCSNCLTRSCTAHNLSLPLQKDITYYCCQICGQSQEFFDGQVIAILDENDQVEQIRQMNVLQVNWLLRRKPFDFDYVKIIEATDEDVERFIVQMGNEANAVQQSRYKEIDCVVSPQCKLSENTMKILQKTFGRVKPQHTEAI